MHSAPSVTYPVQRSNKALLLLMTFWLLGVVSVGVWCYQADRLGVRQITALAALFLTAGAVCWGAVFAPDGRLHWDGQYWSLDGTHPVPAAQAMVVLDFQSLLLLRLKVDRSVTWLWLDRQARAEQWRDVRRALFASPVSAGKTSDEPAQPSGRHSAASIV